jgi:hypothetical protein
MVAMQPYLCHRLAFTPESVGDAPEAGSHGSERNSGARNPAEQLI